MVRILLWLALVIGVILGGGALWLQHSVNEAKEDYLSQELNRNRVLVTRLAEKEAIRTIVEDPLHRFTIQPALYPVYGYTEKDTVWHDNTERVEKHYRQATFGMSRNGTNYRISVRGQLPPDLEGEFFFRDVAVIFLTMGALILGFAGLISYLLWKPLYDMLGKLNTYSPASAEPLCFTRTRTREFQKLQLALEKMSGTMANEFRKLRLFTDDINQEIKVPVTVIKARTAILLQNDDLCEEESRNLLLIRDSAHRVLKTSETLLMLARIDLGRFDLNKVIDFKILFSQKVNQYAELLEMQGCSLKIQNDHGICCFEMNEELANTMMNVLLSRNLPMVPRGSSIEIKLEPGSITVTCPRQPDERWLGQRAEEPDSLIRKICAYERIKYQTQLHENLWIMTFTFGYAQTA